MMEPIVAISGVHRDKTDDLIIDAVLKSIITVKRDSIRVDHHIFTRVIQRLLRCAAASSIVN